MSFARNHIPAYLFKNESCSAYWYVRLEFLMLQSVQAHIWFIFLSIQKEEGMLPFLFFLNYCKVEGCYYA